MIAVKVRRFHDINLSAWRLFLISFAINISRYFSKETKWILLCNFIIVYLILMLKKGNEGENKFGPNPRLKNLNLKSSEEGL